MKEPQQVVASPRGVHQQQQQPPQQQHHGGVLLSVQEVAERRQQQVQELLWERPVRIGGAAQGLLAFVGGAVQHLPGFHPMLQVRGLRTGRMAGGVCLLVQLLGVLKAWSFGVWTHALAHRPLAQTLSISTILATLSL